MSDKYEIIKEASEKIEPFISQVKMRIAVLDSDAPYNLNYYITLDTKGRWYSPDYVYEFLTYFNMLNEVEILEQKIDEDAKQRAIQNGDYDRLMKVHGRKKSDVQDDDRNRI